MVNPFKRDLNKKTNLNQKEKTNEQLKVDAAKGGKTGQAAQRALNSRSPAKKGK